MRWLSRPIFPASESPFAGLDSASAGERLNDPACRTDAWPMKLGVSLSMLETLPLWQIAMVLQATQAQRLGLRGITALIISC
jgi:uncharacterized protein YbaP (TraB family)